MRVHNEHNDFRKFSKTKKATYIIIGWSGIIVMAIIFLMAFMSSTKTFL